MIELIAYFAWVATTALIASSEKIFALASTHPFALSSVLALAACANWVALWLFLRQQRLSHSKFNSFFAFLLLTQAVLGTFIIGFWKISADLAQGQLISGSWDSLGFAFVYLRQSTGSLFLIPKMIALLRILHLALLLPWSFLIVVAWRKVANKTRIRVWRGVDAILVCTFLVVFVLPQVNDNIFAQATRADLRLLVAILCALRLLIRVLVPILRRLEDVSFDWFIASRQLRTNHNPFVAWMTLLSLSAVSLSCAMLVVVLSVMGGFREDLQSKIVGTKAHVLVRSSHKLWQDWQQASEILSKESNVQQVEPYVQGEVLFVTVSANAGAELRGIAPAGSLLHHYLKKYLVSGSLDSLQYDPNALVTGDKESDRHPPVPEIVVGEEIAKHLRAVTGDLVTLVSPYGAVGPNGRTPKVSSVRIGGIIHTGMYEYDVKLAYCSLHCAQDILSMGDSIHGIEVRLKSFEQAPQFVNEISAQPFASNLKVQSWQAMNRQLLSALALEKLAMFAALGVTLLIAAFGVFATMTLMVKDKIREIAVLRALGMPKKNVLSIFMLEGLLLGGLGGFVGLGIGIIASLLAQHFPIHLDPEIYYIDRLPVRIALSESGIISLSTLISCCLVTLIPALQASKVQPVDVLRHE